MANEQVEKFFEVCDGDDDGKVSREELKSKMADDGMDERTVEKIFRYADLNSDGNISKEELTKAMFAAQWEVLFERLDTDDDGTLSVEEIKGLLDDAEGVDSSALISFMEENDVSDDGRLSKEEFCTWINGRD